MAEGEGPDPPRPPVPRVPGQPLPRLWKAEPEPDDADKPPRDRRSRLAAEKEEREAKSESANPKAKSKKTSDRNTSKGTARPKGKGVLIEETPELDTYETRQRARLLFGGLIAAVGLIAIVVVYNSLQGPTFDDEGVVDEGGPPGASPVASGPKPPQVDPKIEQEAKNLLSTARQLAKNGKTQEATVILQRVTKSYPKTAASALAKAAIARPTQNLPLFLDEEMVVASPVSPAKPGAPNVMNVVDASVAPAPSGEPGNATLQLNPNPALTPRAPGAPTQPRAEVAAKPLPPGFRIEDESGVHASGWPYQIVSDRDGAVMVLVPGGVFTLGRDDGTPDEAPAHKVRLSPFYVDQHEVTMRQYDLYLKETGRRRAAPRAVPADGATARAGEDEPVTNITALEAKAYCEWAGKRLPTEAQWEAAARSTDARRYPWGSSEPVWSRPRLPRQIDSVGAYPLDQSPSGALDLAGNAWEWTQDWFDSRYYQQLQSQIADDPSGPTTSRAKPPQVVVKGGSKLWVVSWREGLKPESKLPYVGFRGVLPLATAASPSVAAPSQTPAGRSVTPPPNPRGIVPF